MKKLFALLAVLSFFIATPFAAAQNAERPEIKVGESWTYQDIDDWKNTEKEKYTYTVAAVSDKEIRLSRKSETSGAVVNVTETPDLNFTTKVGYDGTFLQYTPDNGTFVFPLTPGATWKAETNYKKSSGAVGSYSLPAVAAGWEKVTVPAGEFLALKITEEGYYRASVGGSSGQGRMKMTLWYAPQAKGMVKVVYEDTDWGGKTYNRVTTQLAAYKVN